MKTHPYQMAALSLPSVILGLMRIADMPDAEIRALYGAGMDCGMTMFDHADIYGGTLHRCATRYGAALNLSSTARQGIMLQSKVGIRKEFFNFSRDQILKNVDGSLAALKTNYLDILLLHRRDARWSPMRWPRHSIFCNLLARCATLACQIRRRAKSSF